MHAARVGEAYVEDATSVLRSGCHAPRCRGLYCFGQQAHLSNDSHSHAMPVNHVRLLK